jgi:hypothetical protein
MLFFVLLACPLNPDDSGGLACTEIAVSSLNLSVEAPDGSAVIGADVQYTVDGSDPEPCQSWDDGTYVCGYEDSGSIEATVKADGYLEASVVVEVPMDDSGCHVVSQSATLTLEADVVDCTEEVRPSVEVSLSASDGGALSNPVVEWGRPNADMAPQPCSPSGEVWFCGEEAPGELEITGWADGFPASTALVNVEMTADGCHVETEALSLILNSSLR